MTQKHTGNKKKPKHNNNNKKPSPPFQPFSLQAAASWARMNSLCKSKTQFKGAGGGVQDNPRQQSWHLPLPGTGTPRKDVRDKHWCVSAIWLLSLQRLLSWGQLTVLGQPRNCPVRINRLTEHLHSSFKQSPGSPVWKHGQQEVSPVLYLD